MLKAKNFNFAGKPCLPSLWDCMLQTPKRFFKNILHMADEMLQFHSEYMHRHHLLCITHNGGL